MKIEDCFQLGYIIKPHGIQGAFTIFLDTDNPDYYEELESVYVEFKHNLIPFFIEYINIGPSKVTLKLHDIDNIESAKQYKGCTLHLSLKMLPSLDDHQFYYHEIIGFSVKDHAHGNLGVVKSIYEGNSNDLFAINYKGKEVLVPIRDEFIVELDKNRKTILLNLPEGLLDVYLNP